MAFTKATQFSAHLHCLRMGVINSNDLECKPAETYFFLHSSHQETPLKNIIYITPTNIHAPAGAYSHAAVIKGAGRTLYISGQLGIDPAGVTAEDFSGQAAQCWRNITAILNCSGMTVHDLVKVTTFLTNVDNAAELGSIRATFLDGARPASTIVGTSALLRPEWQIEVEAIAFKND